MTSILITGYALGDSFDNEAGEEKATVVLVVGGQSKSQVERNRKVKPSLQILLYPQVCLILLTPKSV